ncbi:pimeloyl-ACP methyl ester esterase BioH [Sulfuriflexus sp.]|uniref:pimeloyl-ACP methyl ester esterase BioH n=1 Tax=Sulfuriflexus sp. TaxID=2015443 RepID=UPI0028CC2F18|nr:pimeloyl-ACP methyl ester esterase BioH [Sulfuriflexus sp.]MDT8403559.1 pimeloyl-ACP methyl ester esterase BioH [Sulfuriflexus sp.]
MKLYSETSGEGPELILLHGWGAHSGVWTGLRELLSASFRVTCIDLPGHGHSPYTASAMVSLPVLAEAVLAIAPPRASWLGWSLGGLVAQQVALLEPGRVERMILLGSTPSFIRREDWACAVEAGVFEKFNEDLLNDPQATLLRFIALQTRGSKQAGDDARLLRRMLLEPSPDSGALQAGLQLLRQVDLREQARKNHASTLLLTGTRDTLVPKQALSAMAALFPNAGLALIDRAGHAPFLSHRDETYKVIHRFMTDTATVSEHA